MNQTMTVENQTPQSVWSLLVSIVDKPKATFENLVAYPRFRWVLPLVLAIVVTVAYVWISMPYSSEMAVEATRQQLAQSGMSPEETERMMANTAQFRSPVFIGAVGSVTGSVMIGVIMLATATLLYFVSLVAGAELNFGAVFTVVAWSGLPTTLRSVVQGGITLFAGRFPLYPGLAALQVSGDPMVDAGNPLLTLLSFADIFWIWHIILLVIGLAVATKFSRVKAFFIVLLYAVLSIAVAVGFTFLRGAAGA